MSKITASAELESVKAEELPKFATLFAQDVTQLLNGRLGFADNFDAKIVSQTFSSANTNALVAHGLGRVATNYIVLSKDVACDIYSGSGSTSGAIGLKSTVAPATVSLLIF